MARILRVLKTLKTVVDGKPVGVIVPSDQEFSMKKLAAAGGGKSAQMMKLLRRNALPASRSARSSLSDSEDSCAPWSSRARLGGSKSISMAVNVACRCGSNQPTCATF